MGLSGQKKRRLQEKTGILDELVKTTGYNRKYALHILADWGKLPRPVCREKQSSLRPPPASGKKAEAGSWFTLTSLSPSYGISGFSSGMSAGRYSPLEHICFLEPAFFITPEVKGLLLKAIPTTIDRKLKVDTTLMLTKKPGFFEIDTVHHCGVSDQGQCGL